jgi:hypothetical protein
MINLGCLSPDSALEIKCECFDQKSCDIHIDDGGNLVCRYGSNESVLNGAAAVTCPLEIASERVKWEEFLQQEMRES